MHTNADGNRVSIILATQAKTQNKFLVVVLLARYIPAAHLKKKKKESLFTTACKRDNRDCWPSLAYLLLRPMG